MSSGDNTLTKSLKISDTTKTKFFELKSFQSDKKIWQNYCREVFSSLSDFLTSWLSITILTEGFLAIYVTTLLAVYNFGNTSAIKAIFFFKMFKIWRRFQKFWKKLRKFFFVFELIPFELVPLNTHFYREREYLSSGVHMLSKSLKISDTTKTKFFEQKLLQSDQNYVKTTAV